MTVEDPVEFNIYGINQVQVSQSIDLTFASVLRSFLRQDPNIILVGEIRDNETASSQSRRHSPAISCFPRFTRTTPLEQ